MSMVDLPIVAVVGATGQQGGGVVRALAKSGKFRIRALVRDVNKASDMSRLPNVELHVFDYSVTETVNKALAGGVHAVFGVTNSHDPVILNHPELEVVYGKRLVDAAVRNVKYLVWSGLPGTNEISKGKYKVSEYDNKYEVEKYARSQSSLSCIFVYPSFYLQNFAMMLQLDGNGYQCGLPLEDQRALEWIDVEDVGKVVLALLNSPDEYIGRVISASAGAATGKQFGESFTRVTGKRTAFTSITIEEYKKGLPPEMAEDLAGAFQFYNEYGLGDDSLNVNNACTELHVSLTSLDEAIARLKLPNSDT